MNTLDPIDSAQSANRARSYQQLAELLTAARAGRRESLEQIVVELSPLLWHVARAQGLDSDTAQDAVQCAWLRLLGHLDQIHSPIALTAWLITTTKREAWQARAAVHGELLVDENSMTQILDPIPTPEEDVLLNEQQREVWQAVRRLPQRCQDLLRVVAFVHRPDYDQLAAALEMPRGSVGPTRIRCLAKLRDLLDAEPKRSPT